MKKTIIVLLIISIFSLGFYGCTQQEPPQTDDENLGTENQETPDEDQQEPPQEVTKEVTLYFGGPNAEYVVPEKRTINVPEDIEKENYIKRVLEELIKGPETENLNFVIPSETKVLSVNIENNIAYVDFSEEMHTKHWGGAAGESMTINSIANTLTEFDYIDKVKITVDGEPLAIEHMILEEPVGRNEDMIAK